jgi:hypothetical protein
LRDSAADSLSCSAACAKAEHTFAERTSVRDLCDKSLRRSCTLHDRVTAAEPSELVLEDDK